VSQPTDPSGVTPAAGPTAEPTPASPAPAAPATSAPEVPAPGAGAPGQPDPATTPAPTAAPPGPTATPASAAPVATGDPTAAPPPAAPPVAPTAGGQPPKPAGGRLKPPVIIGAVVGAVALVGGGFALLGGSKDDGGSSREEATVITVPPGLDVLDPTVGPQPAEPVDPEPLPGPPIDPVVVTTTTMPTPTTVPAPPPSSDAVAVGAGTSVTPASGWAVTKQHQGFVQLNREAGGAEAYASLWDSSLGATADEATIGYLQEMVVPYVAELETTSITPQNVSGNLTSSASVQYRGMLASQSGGATPVEGFVLVMLRPDGSVAVWEEMNQAGIYEEVEADLIAMANSFIRSL